MSSDDQFKIATENENIQKISYSDIVSIDKSITQILNTGSSYTIELPNNPEVRKTKYITVCNSAPQTIITLKYTNELGNPDIIKFGDYRDIIVLFSTEKGWRKVYTFISKDEFTN